MFSKELEDLIQATLADGKLEEHEKAALIKRAQREDVDLDELEIHIQSILQKRQIEADKAEDAKQEEIDKRKKEALGRICPQCNKPVPPLAVKCSCGYEFQTSQTESSLKKLLEKLENIGARPVEGKNGWKRSKIKDKNASEMINLITLYPVPNTKEEIIEFCSTAASLATSKKNFFLTRNGFATLIFMFFLIIFLWVMKDTISIEDEGVVGWIFGSVMYAFMMSFIPMLFIFHKSDNDVARNNRIANAWKTKLNQILMKGRSFRGDPEFAQQLNYYDNLINPKKS